MSAVANLPTPEDIARAMLEKFSKHGRLDHHTAVRIVRQLSGVEFLYTNRNGNDAIKLPVLDAFRALPESADIVWGKHSHCWRRRRDSDPPGVREVSS